MPRPARLAAAALAALAVAGPAAAHDPGGRRYAVLVGVNKYDHGKLPALRYAAKDATDLAAALTRAGYEIALLTDALGAADPAAAPTKANVDKQLRATLDRCRRGDTVLVALAGHGVQFEGGRDAYFCPQDARPFPDRADTLVSLSRVYADLEESFAGVKVLLVDACRDDPAAGRNSRGVDADAAPAPPRGVAALFSCSAGERAFEHDALGNGVFFHYVLQGLDGKAKDADGEVTFGGLATYVQKQVVRQVPRLVGGGARQSPNLRADLSGASPVLVTVKAAAVAANPFRNAPPGGPADSPDARATAPKSPPKPPAKPAADPRAVIRAAIKAHKLPADGTYDRVYGAGRGKILSGTQWVEAELQRWIDFPTGRFRNEVSATANGQTVKLVVGCDGQTVWQTLNGVAAPVSQAEADEHRANLRHTRWAMLTPLLADPAVKLDPVPDADVGGKPAVGVQAAAKGVPALRLYFDKATSLLVREDAFPPDPAKPAARHLATAYKAFGDRPTVWATGTRMFRGDQLVEESQTTDLRPVTAAELQPWYFNKP